MGQRLELHSILKEIMDGNKVYFQPPESLKMEYPCIVYNRDNRNTIFANNKPYKHTQKYQVTVIDRDPDSKFPDKVAELPLCRETRTYITNNLNHSVFTIFF